MAAPDEPFPGLRSHYWEGIAERYPGIRSRPEIGREDRPVYRPTAAFGHFGRTEAGFEWEKTDKADLLRDELLGKPSKNGRKVLAAA